MKKFSLKRIHNTTLPKAGVAGSLLSVGIPCQWNSTQEETDYRLRGLS